MELGFDEADMSCNRLLATAVAAAAAYQGVNHAFCLVTPLTGGTLLKAQLDRAVAGTFRQLMFGRLFDLHRFLDVALHSYFAALWIQRILVPVEKTSTAVSVKDVAAAGITAGTRRAPWNLIFLGVLASAHLLAFVSHMFRYMGMPVAAYERVTLPLFQSAKRVQLELVVDCLAQATSSGLLLGVRGTALAVVAQLGLRRILQIGLDVNQVAEASPHNGDNVARLAKAVKASW